MSFSILLLLALCASAAGQTDSNSHRLFGGAGPASKAGTYRSIDGSRNNPNQPQWGRTTVPYAITIGGRTLVETVPEFADGLGSLGAPHPSAVQFDRTTNRTFFTPSPNSSSILLPTARFLSNELFAFGANETRPGDLPSFADPPNSRRKLSDVTTYFGHILSVETSRSLQTGDFAAGIGDTAREVGISARGWMAVSQELLLVPETYLLLKPPCLSKSFPIPIPPCDPVFDATCSGTPTPANMSFSRFVAVTNSSDSPGRRKALNAATAWVDLSMLYTETNDTALSLRRMSDGLLKSHLANVTFAINGSTVTREMEFLPLVGEINGPWSEYHIPRAGSSTPTDLFIISALSLNGSPPTVSLLTLFHRNHNSIARFLKYQNPSWTDEVLFQEARRRNIAIYQRIVYLEYLPVILGSNALRQYAGWNRPLNPTTDCFFAAVTMRYGHSEIPDYYAVKPPPSLPLAGTMIPLVQAMFRPLEWLTSYEPASFILGSAANVQREVDVYYSEALRTTIWDLPNRGGRDEAAIDIQRAREMGCWWVFRVTTLVRETIVQRFAVPSFGNRNYVNARKTLGLADPTFSSLSDDPALSERIRKAYAGNMSLVDSMVATYAEPRVNGGNLGETTFVSLVKHFEAVRDADRFFYLNPDANFTALELEAISNATLRTVLLANSYGLSESDVPKNLWAVGSSTAVGTDGDLALKYTNSLKLTPDYSFYWKIDGNTFYGAQQISGTNGWAGIGFSRDIGLTMPGADFVISSKDETSNAYHVEQYVSSGKGFDRPEERTPAKVTMISANTSADGKTTIFEWSRPLDTGLPGAQIISRGPRQMIFAYDTAQPYLVFHGANRGTFVVDLFAVDPTAVVSTTSTVVMATRTIHGIGMILIFALVYPFAVYIARYSRHTDYWLTVHTTAQSVGGVSFVALGTAAAATVAAIAVSSHAIVGITIFSMVAVQLVLGFAARLGLSKRYTGYLPMKYAHRIFGALILIMGWVNIHLGLQKQWPSTYWIGSIVVGCVELFWILLFLLTELGYQGVIAFPMPDDLIKPAMIQMKRFSNKVMGTADYEDDETPLTQSKAARSREDGLVPMMDWNEVNKRVSEGDEWLVIGDGVYDISTWKATHPGGKEVLKRMIGLDVTAEFYDNTDRTNEPLESAADGSTVVKGTTVTRNQARVRNWFRTNPEAGQQQQQDLPMKSFTVAKAPVADLHPHSTFAETKLESLLVARLIGGTRTERSRQEFRRFQVTKKVDVSLATVVPRYRGSPSPDSENDRDPRPARRFSLIPISNPRKGDDQDILPGQTIELRARIKKKIVVRSYTPISGSFAHGFDLAIKIYPRGLFTSYLDSVQPAKLTVEASGPHGTPLLCPNRQDGCWDVLLMIAGGSGVTPMLQLIRWHLYRHTRGTGSAPTMRLVFSNHTENEAMELGLLQQYVAESDGRFQLQLEYGKLEIGHLDAALDEVLDAEADLARQVVVCGPIGFGTSVTEYLNLYLVPKEIVKVL